MTDLVDNSVADESFGERLLILGSGPVPIDGARSATLALGRDGATVLIVDLDGLSSKAAIDIADHLDRLSRYSEEDLAALRRGVMADGDLHEQFSTFFDSPAPSLNRRTRVFVLVDEEPSLDAWKALAVELGTKLTGVYLTKAGASTPLAIPDALTRPRGGPVTPSVVALIAVLLIGAFIVYSVKTATDPRTALGRSSIRTVLAGAQVGATHSQWVGQQRLLRSVEGDLLALVTTDDELQIVTDSRNQGRSWFPPVSVRGIEAVSVSADIDDENRIHLAYSDGRSIRFTTLQAAEGAWKHGRILRLGDRTTSPVLDLAWDEKLDVAHVVWADDHDGDHQPRWASVSVSGGKPRVTQTAGLAPAGSESTVLVNVAVAPGQEATATYRKGQPAFGWFSRTAVPRGHGGFELQKEQELPTGAFIGAGDVAVDKSGTTHVVLRDSDQTQLVYSQRPMGGAWSEMEVAVDEETIEQIDFPALTVDGESNLVHLFFQSDRYVDATEVRATVRDPAGGWLDHFAVASEDDLPNGAAFPSTMGTTSGSALVLWTTTLGSPEIQIANVVAP